MIHTNLGIIADDLTGALDTGVQFSKWGLRSLVMLTDSPLSEVPCVVLNTDSRAAPPQTAEEQVRRAARLLRGRLVYKKIDSTLRGNVGVEMLAAMQELAAQKAVVAPAFPANGRTTLGGRLFVRGVPLEQTGFAHDPRNAVKESHIPTVLQRQTGHPIASVSVDKVEQGVASLVAAIACCSEAIVVVDAVEQQHLATIARAVTEANATWLPVGSAGLAEGLAPALGLSKEGLVPPEWAPAQAPLLILAGSRNEVTAAQIREAFVVLDLPAVEPDPRRLVDAAEGAREVTSLVETVSQFLADGHSVIVTTCFAPHLVGGSLELAVALGRAIRLVMDRSDVGGLFITGGDIALQVCLVLGGQALRPITEVLPGLPASLLVGGRWEGLRIVTKAGGFGEKDAIVVGFRYLMEGTKGTENGKR